MELLCELIRLRWIRIRSDPIRSAGTPSDKGREGNSVKKSNMKINSSPDVRGLWQIMTTLGPVLMNTRTHLSMSQELGPPVGVASTSIHVAQLRKHADEISKDGGEATRSLCKFVASVRPVHDITCAPYQQIASLEASSVSRCSDISEPRTNYHFSTHRDRDRARIGARQETKPIPRIRVYR